MLCENDCCLWATAVCEPLLYVSHCCVWATAICEPLLCVSHLCMRQLCVSHCCVWATVEPLLYVSHYCVWATTVCEPLLYVSHCCVHEPLPCVSHSCMWATAVCEPLLCMSHCCMSHCCVWVTAVCERLPPDYYNTRVVVLLLTRVSQQKVTAVCKWLMPDYYNTRVGDAVLCCTNCMCCCWPWDSFCYVGSQQLLLPWGSHEQVKPLKVFILGVQHLQYIDGFRNVLWLVKEYTFSWHHVQEMESLWERTSPLYIMHNRCFHECLVSCLRSTSSTDIM